MAVALGVVVGSRCFVPCWLNTRLCKGSNYSRNLFPGRSVRNVPGVVRRFPCQCIGQSAVSRKPGKGVFCYLVVTDICKLFSYSNSVAFLAFWAQSAKSARSAGGA